MGTWIFVIGFFGACIAIGTAWDALRERSSTANAISEGAAATVDRISWLFMKICGIGCFAVAGVGIYLSGEIGGELIVASVLFAAYGAYLLFPGGSDDKTFWVF